MSQTLQISQLLALASEAGFSGSDLAVAVAVALAESGGNPEAYNPERAANAPQGQGSFGLWQIYLHAHPEFNGQNLFDPQVNAAAAYAVYAAAGNSFRPWSTFTAGSYLAKMDAVNQALGAISAGDATASTASPDGNGDSGDGGGSGFTPSGTDTIVLLIGGALFFYVLARAFA